MTDRSVTLQSLARARGDVAAERVCLRCKVTFWSDGFGERICPHCQSSSLWRSTVPFSARHRARRASGRAW